MDKIYCIKNKDNGLYMNINNKKKDAFNTMDIILTSEPCHWVFNEKDKIIRNIQVGGYIIQTYHGWMPDTSNILLLNENSYDICFKPLMWEYEDFLLSTTGTPEILYLFINFNASSILLFGAIVIGSRIIPLSLLLTLSTSRACCSIDKFL